jgi:hypothetical protein
MLRVHPASCLAREWVGHPAASTGLTLRVAMFVSGFARKVRLDR